MKDTLQSLQVHCGGELSETQRLVARRVSTLEAELIYLEDKFAQARAEVVSRMSLSSISMAGWRIGNGAWRIRRSVGSGRRAILIHHPMTTSRGFPKSRRSRSRLLRSRRHEAEGFATPRSSRSQVARLSAAGTIVASVARFAHR
jgi:hypothetical protein